MTGAPPGHEGDRAFATSLARGLSVLRAFRAGDDGLSNAQIAERTGLPKSTVSRLTYTLGALGYLTQPHRNDRYRLGPTLLAMGHVTQVSLSFLEPAQEMMQTLADETGALVLFALRDRDKMALMRIWRPVRAAPLWPEVGQRLPMAGSSSGLAVLGASTPEEFARLLADHPDPHNPDPHNPDPDADPGLGPPPTTTTTPAPQALRREARGQLAGQGYVILRETLLNAPRIAAVSVPFRPARIAGPGAFTCAAPVDALPETRLHAEIGPRLRDTVARLNRQTGAMPAWNPDD